MDALIYAGGVITGMAMMLANAWSVRKAVERERKRSDRLMLENARLQDELRDLMSSRDCADAYRRGKEKGRMDPVSDAERFARNFEGRRTQFRGQRSA